MRTIIGIVKWWSDEKGYGFISTTKIDGDIFAHYADIQMSGFKSLCENQEVEFVVDSGPKGNIAKNITPKSPHTGSVMCNNLGGDSIHGND